MNKKIPQSIIIIAVFLLVSLMVKPALGFSYVGTTTANTNENNTYTSGIDVSQNHIYYGADTAPGKVVEFYLSNNSYSQNITLNTNENQLRASVIDTTRGFLYFGTYTTAGRIVKINISNNNFTRVGAIILSSGENLLFTGACWRSASMPPTRRPRWRFTAPRRS